MKRLSLGLLLSTLLFSQDLAGSETGAPLLSEQRGGWGTRAPLRNREGATLYAIGAARVDITPDYPIRLSGYGGRQKESEGIDQHLFAKALAVGSDKEGATILITVDNAAVPAYVRDEVAARLSKKAGVRNERVAVCCTHTHTAPMLKDVVPTLYGTDIPADQQERIDRYTRELIDKMEQAGLAALKDRKPATLLWGQTSAGFAANRRPQGGPVDHDLPVLVARDKTGSIRAVLVSYACHCTTLSDTPNHVCGDWAGYAQEYLERDHPGAVALVALGCGADSDPSPRTGLELAKRHGQAVTSAVNELLARTLTPLRQKLECRTKAISLPFDTLPTREAWQKRAESPNRWIAYHAKRNLARMDRGEKLPTELPYLVQSWNFGNELAMVFLPGEVVVDYSLRLKKEYDSARLWVNAYANDVPCYIPSRRIWREGGYEGGDAMIYFDRPTRLAEQTEETIIAAVRELMPKSFLFDEKQAEFPPPKSPQESLAAMQTKAGFEIELVAAEPLVVDPVAIDWGPDGKLWVVEMRDYPMGMDGKWKPGSRVKYLEDTNGDGKYDKATVFLDNLPFATGVTAWRKGVLVCAAPDILYAEEGRGEKGEGRRGNVRVTKVFSGFVTENYQARVNSLSLGLDNWIYGANGLLGGVIRGEAIGISGAAGRDAFHRVPRSRRGRWDAVERVPTTLGMEVDIRGRDFRMKPDTGEFEPASGLTQQGRVRDDWGNWFGCDNSTLAWHYPIPDHYIRRNPHVPAPSPRVSVAGGDDPNLLHPISRTLERFNNPESANRVTSGCGISIYRDDLLGGDIYGNAFLCEPVHNLVHRLVLKPNSVTFTGLRAGDEQQGEFLASRDNWFRPVQARTGPDGALWVVDMYRFVIEHPRWITPERLAKLDVRAGDDKGRIYRVYPKGKKLRPIRDLTRLSPAQLAAALDTANGTERDRVHQEIVFGGERRQGTGEQNPKSEIRNPNAEVRGPKSDSDKSRAGVQGPKSGGTGSGKVVDREMVGILESLAGKSSLPAVRLQALCVLDGLGALKGEMVERALADPVAAVRANAIRLTENLTGGNRGNGEGTAIPPQRRGERRVENRDRKTDLTTDEHRSTQILTGGNGGNGEATGVEPQRREERRGNEAEANALNELNELNGLNRLNEAGASGNAARGATSSGSGGALSATGDSDLARALVRALVGLVDDPDLFVRFQLALTLGEWGEAGAGAALGKLAAKEMGDVWMRAAVLSSAARHPAEILKAVLAADMKQAGRSEMISQIIATATGEGRPDSLGKVIAAIAPRDSQRREVWQLTALSSLLDALERKGLALTCLAQGRGGEVGQKSEIRNPKFETNSNRTESGKYENRDAEIREAVERLNVLFDWARALASEPQTKDWMREPAIHLLGRSPERQGEDLRVLAGLLGSSVSARSQTAALETLKRIRAPKVPGLLLEDWKLHAPSLRQASLEVLLSREEWVKDLLGALEAGAVGLGEIPAASRQRLLKHSDKTIQQRAQALWQADPSASRAQVLAKYQSATTLPGDSAKGATVFGNLCATCHFLRGQGHNVGPNLAALADKTPADFLTAILDPNAVVEPRFIAYNIETKDGRSLSGIVNAETATTLTLVQSGGAQEKILRGDIAEIRASGLSLMPENLEQNLTPQDLADLIAYLKTSPHRWASATPEQAEAAKKKFLAGGANGVAKIVSAFDRLPYPSWMGSLPMPYCRQADGNSKLAWQTAPAPAGLKPDAPVQFRLAAAMGYLSQPEGKFTLRLNGQAVLDFGVTVNDQTWQSADGKVRMGYTVMENNAEDGNGVLVLEVAGGLLEPGRAATFEVIGSAAGSQRWFGVYLLTESKFRAAK